MKTKNTLRVVLSITKKNKVEKILFGVGHGFQNSFTKSPPFHKFDKKSPPIILYSNFPLKGALFSQKSFVINFILD